MSDCSELCEKKSRERTPHRCLLIFLVIIIVAVTAAIVLLICMKLENGNGDDGGENGSDKPGGEGDKSADQDQGEPGMKREDLIADESAVLNQDGEESQLLDPGRYGPGGDVNILGAGDAIGIQEQKDQNENSQVADEMKAGLFADAGNKALYADSVRAQAGERSDNRRRDASVKVENPQIQAPEAPAAAESAKVEINVEKPQAIPVANPFPQPETKQETEKEFRKACLDAHNEYRTKHGSPPLELSNKLNKYSKQWATNLAKENVMRHRKDSIYGENLYAKFGKDTPLNGRDAVDSWYREVRDYAFDKEYQPGDATRTGHFTQVIWKGSKRMGCSRAESPSGAGGYVVANYDPAGNMMGSFMENVPKPVP